MNNGKSQLVPKHCGGDFEIGHFIEGEPTGTGDTRRAARSLLAQTEGMHGVQTPLSQSGRKWLKNGGCAYIDCQHLELPMPIVRGALDHCAAMRGMFGVARAAMDRVNAELPPGERLRMLLNNSDGKGNSFGTHLNFLISATAFENIMRRGQPYLQFLASFQAVTVPLFGQGKIGAENGTPPVDYQMAQRADFCRHTLLSENTMHPGRPLVNSRDESHCGHSDLKRLHVIAYDNSLAQVNCVLKVGLMQIALAMIEAEEMPEDLILADPLQAIVSFSHDPTLQARAAQLGGGFVSAAEWLDLWVTSAQRFAEDGRLEGIVPDWALILSLASETAGHLLRRDYAELARRLDSFLKLAVLQEAMKLHHLDWQSPALKMLDHLYSSLGDDGLFWPYEKADLVITLVSPAAIEKFQHSPPPDTRASIRAKLLQLIPSENIVTVDWDRVVFTMTDKDQRPVQVPVLMFNPIDHLKPGSALARAASFQDLVEISTTSPGELDFSHPYQPQTLHPTPASHE